jgi:hypothetical protein
MFIIFQGLHGVSLLPEQLLLLAVVVVRGKKLNRIVSYVEDVIIFKN